MFFQRHSTQIIRLLVAVLFLVLTSQQTTAQRIIYPSSFLGETFPDTTAIYVDGKIMQISADRSGKR